MLPYTLSGIGHLICVSIIYYICDILLVYIKRIINYIFKGRDSMNQSNDIVSKFTDLFDIPNDDKEYRVSLYILHKLYPKDSNRVEISIRKEDIELKKAIDKYLCDVILMLPDRRSENLVSILSFINDLSVKKNGKYDKILEKYLIRSSLDMIFKENTMKVVFKKYFLVGKGKKEKLYILLLI